MMKWTLSIVLVLLVSCERQRHFDDEIVDEWTKSEPPIPSRYGGLFMFVKGQSGYIGIGNLGSLHNLYQDGFSTQYPSFRDFVKIALNENVALTNEQLQRNGWIVSAVDQNMKTKYDENGISKLIDENSRVHGDELIINSEKINSSELYTFMYLLFINKYTLAKDDYVGAYYAKRRK